MRLRYAAVGTAGLAFAALAILLVAGREWLESPVRILIDVLVLRRSRYESGDYVFVVSVAGALSVLCFTLLAWSLADRGPRNRKIDAYLRKRSPPEPPGAAPAPPPPLRGPPPP